MKKQFTNAAEELIAGIGQTEMPVEEKHESPENEVIPDNHYVRYVEPRSERIKKNNAGIQRKKNVQERSYKFHTGKLFFTPKSNMSSTKWSVK